MLVRCSEPFVLVHLATSRRERNCGSRVARKFLIPGLSGRIEGNAPYAISAEI